MGPNGTLLDDGRWHLAVGDPTVVGWVVCFTYAACALLCWRAWRSCAYGRRALAKSVPQESLHQARLATWWALLAVLMALLALNKQLDLQTLMTELARDMAHSQGWYEGRRTAQRGFLVLLGLGFLAAALGLGWWLRQVASRIVLAASGLVVVLSFVLLRAATFQHLPGFDALLDDSAWMMELLGCALIGIGAWRATVRTDRASA